jgi:hypothetical protein
MGQQLSTLASVLASTAVRAWRVVMDSLCSVERPGIYHPEAHYMRGPGPRWREKHAQGRNIAL